MKSGTIAHPKMRALARELGIALWQANGLVDAIVQFVVEYAPAGNIGRYTNEDIAGGCWYDGNADRLIAVLVDVGWIDEHTEHRLVVHDWADHIPDYLKKRLARSGQEVVAADDTPPLFGVSPRGAVRRRSAPTQPNQTLPNRTEPRPGESSIASPGSGARQSDDRGGEPREDSTRVGLVGLVGDGGTSPQPQPHEDAGRHAGDVRAVLAKIGVQEPTLGQLLADVHRIPVADVLREWEAVATDPRLTNRVGAFVTRLRRVAGVEPGPGRSSAHLLAGGGSRARGRDDGGLEVMRILQRARDNYAAGQAG